jgi:hypothetical protein
MRGLIISLICSLFIGAGAAAYAQAQEPPDLIVELRDVNGAGIVGVTVIVRDDSSDRELARARTDAQGIASFAGLTENAVRVAVEGALPGGTRLYLLGNDAEGIALLLSEPPARLNLRSEPDGRVIPDPATMIAPDTGVPKNADASVAALPTAPLALPARLAAATPAMIPNTGPAGGATSETPIATTKTSLWPGVLLLATLCAAIVAAVMLHLRWRRL